MKQKDFEHGVSQYAEAITQIRESAHRLHDQVNQTYDQTRPYGFHLDMVAAAVRKFGYEVCADEADILPLFFGAFYHDSIEDARLSYNDVKHTALQWMDENRAHTAAEIVYALTNEKGRTRSERANDKYYHGICQTAYAPFVKLADRLANITYSFTHAHRGNLHMKEIYQTEWPHFLAAITAEQKDQRFALPQSMIDEVIAVMNGKHLLPSHTLI